MRSRGLATRRALTACTLTAVGAAVAGCTAPAGSTLTVSGTTLAIYASAPAQAADPRLGQDVLDAERLALQQTGAQLGRFTVRLVTLGGRASDNARRAIQDSTAIAYLGEVAPHSSYASLGITNAVDLLQVSPTDTALELTRTSPAVPGSPGVYYESLSTYGRTFARVVPSTALEARAQVQEMQSLHVKKLYVADDGGPYGKAIALAVEQDASPAITVVTGPADAARFGASGADALFVGATSYAVAAPLIRSVATTRPGAKVFAPSALDTTRFAAELTPARVNLYVSAPGFLPRSLTAAGKRFVADFRAAYGHAPAFQAVFGYEAMAAVLGVLREAGSSANNRSTVVHDFFAIRNRDSVLGAYSINADGDTSLAPFVFSHLSGGVLVPYGFVQVRG